MEYKTLHAQDVYGNALKEAICTVYVAGTTNLASVFDSLGNAKSNPFLSGATDGSITFAAADGLYDINVVTAGHNSTIQSVQLLSIAGVTESIELAKELATTYFAATKAAGDTLASSLPDGATVIVDRDESLGGVSVRYTVIGGVLGGVVPATTPTVAIMSDLESLPKPTVASGKTVVVGVGGFADVGDGGGGNFYWQGNSNETPIAGMIVNPTGNAGAGRWKRSVSGKLLVEMFGASTAKTSAENAASITTALNYLGDNSELGQYSNQLTTDGFISTNAVKGARITLNLLYSGTTAVGAVAYLNGFERSMLDISIDGDGGNTHGLRCDDCTGSYITEAVKIHNFEATTQLVSGIFTRDSDAMNIKASISDITSDGDQVIRGVIVSDQDLLQNTTVISARFENIIAPIGASVNDADAIYVESSTSSHIGGTKIIGSDFKNCSKRYVKIATANAIVANNTGKNTINNVMYSFVSLYANEAGYVGGNDFENAGTGGASQGIEIGVPANNSTVRIGKNRLVCAAAASSSYAFRVYGKCKDVEIEVGHTSGFTGIMAHDSSVSGATGQSILIHSGYFDNLSSPAQNAILVRGGFLRLDVHNIHTLNAVAARYLVSAAEVSAGIANITDNVHAYSFGRLFGNRPNNAWDAASAANNTEARYILGKAIMRRASTAPTTGAWLVGDLVEYTAPVAGGNIGQVCVTAGSPGTWKAYGSIAA